MIVGDSQKTKKEYRRIRYIFRNESDKACFQDDMAYADFKNLTRI